MSKRSKVWQLICCIVSSAGVVGLGIEIFANKTESLGSIYFWGVFTFIGLLGNFVFALANLKER